MVSDGKYNDTASVSIKVLDVNDNDPYFDQAEFKFSILEVCYKFFCCSYSPQITWLTMI